MRISSSQIFNRGLNAILDQQSAVSKSQLQVATGKRILTPADDPGGAKKILDLNETLELTRQYQSNAATATSRLASEDSVLDRVTNVLQRARELAIQGNNSTLTGTDRQAIAAELEERLGELLGLANTRDANDEYLFAGFSTRTRPFATDGAGNFIYNGDQGQRELQVGPSYRVADGDSGADVFQTILNGNGTFCDIGRPHQRRHRCGGCRLGRRPLGMGSRHLYDHIHQCDGLRGARQRSGSRGKRRVLERCVDRL